VPIKSDIQYPTACHTHTREENVTAKKKNIGNIPITYTLSVFLSVP
jgi:hypothetical protein